jgi:glutamine phosphoribosylpyrophosphate amidotransferase
MCALFGCDLEEVTQNNIQTIQRIALESQVRGKHATGISYIGKNGLETITEPVCAQEFLNLYDLNDCVSDDCLTLIGHCRYSTSDIRYNQPLTNGSLAIAHNGVIEQSPPETWIKFGYQLKTTNDSELVLRAIENKEQPLKKFTDASMAVLELRETGSMRYYRNGKRPLWKSEVKNGFFLTSTKDIALRAGLKNPIRCLPGFLYQGKAATKLVEVEDLISV